MLTNKQTVKISNPIRGTSREFWQITNDVCVHTPRSDLVLKYLMWTEAIEFQWHFQIFKWDLLFKWHTFEWKWIENTYTHRDTYKGENETTESNLLCILCKENERNSKMESFKSILLGILLFQWLTTTICGDNLGKWFSTIFLNCFSTPEIVF